MCAKVSSSAAAVTMPRVTGSVRCYNTYGLCQVHGLSVGTCVRPAGARLLG